MTNQFPQSNPYASPASQLSSKEQTRQQKLLTFYLLLRDSPPTFMSLFVRMLPQQMLTLALFGIVIAIGLAYAVFREGSYLPLLCMAIFLAGGFWGKFAADLGLIRRTLQAWPTLQDVIDWQKVETRLTRESTASNGASQHTE